MIYSQINGVEDIVNKVKRFHASHQGYAFMYNDGSMVKLSLGMKMPKTIVKYKDNIRIVERNYETAYVGFNNENGKNIIFNFNKYFAETLNSKEIAFVFAHESLHVLLDHGRRGNQFLKSLPKEKQDKKFLNMAMDICINEILMNEVFKNDIEYMPIFKTMCTVKNIFHSKNIMDVEYGKGFEYYYFKILENSVESSGETMFGDAIMDDEDIDQFSDILDDIIEKGDIDDNNVNDKVKSNGTQDGSGAVPKKEITSTFVKMSMQEVVDTYVKPRNIAMEDLNSPQKPKYNWYKENRRTIGLTSDRKNNMIIPNRVVKHNIKKMKLVIYADVSGSVANYTKQFMGMIDDIDLDRVEMDIYVWATSVGKAKKNTNSTYAWGNVGGSTNIDAVISHYTTEYKNDMTDAVIVLTDGEYRNIDTINLGNHYDVTKWIFMMTQGHMPKSIFNKSISVEIDFNK